MNSDGFIRVVYRVRGDAEHAERTARAIAYEQTVELPEAQVRDPDVLERVVGRIEGIEAEPDHADSRLVHVAYRGELASRQLGQLFNLVYGNVSMYPGVRLLRMLLPGATIRAFPGPGYGIAGVRRLTGVYGRPLLATAAKPRGISTAALANIVHEFARGGGDIVKDDQNLVDSDFDGFRRRVDACAEAVERANAATGRRCLYLPHLAGRDEDLEREAEFVRERGLAGVLICPLVTGLDRARALAQRYGFLFMAHPALSGAYTTPPQQGIAHGVLLGTLFRLAGADVSVFPAPGGRFAYTPEQCEDIVRGLCEPLAAVRPALPAPAGGMRLELIPDLARSYGANAVILVGGSLLGHPDGVAGGTRAFADAIRRHFDERLEAPAEPYASACELPAAAAGVRQLLPVGEDFHWEGRGDQVYKTSAELPFRGVRRVELIGKGGERAAFALRYFELEPGGYTSLEKHVHTHVLIGARGRGVVVMDGERMPLRRDDVAYVAPLRVHQLRNESEAPFGFYCIVDRERDRPMPP